MRFPLAAVLLGTALVVLSGCSSRDHDNPLDPENPETGGNPSVLRVLGGDGCAEIRWDTLGLRDLREQLLWRRINGSEILVGEFGPDVNVWCDEFVSNGSTYSYALGWRFGNSEETVELPAATTRPGSAWVWVADVTGGGLFAMTPDAQHVRFGVGSGRAILDLTVHPATGVVWGADFDSDEILSYDPVIEEVQVIELSGVNTLAFDPQSETLWAGAFFEEAAFALNTSGEILATFRGMGLVEDVDPIPGDGAYVAARGGEVHRLSRTNDPDLVLQVSWPVSVQYDPSLDGVWICDRGAGEVLFLPEAGGGVETVVQGLDVPVDLGIDGRGGCWVADRIGQRVLRVTRDGGADVTVDLGIEPEGVTVDSLRNEIWVAGPTDGQVRLLAEDGGEIFRWEGTLWPKKVEGAWSPQQGWNCGAGKGAR